MIQNERLIRWKNSVKRGKMYLTPTFDVDEEVARTVSTRAGESEKPVYQIRPYDDDGGIRDAIPLINSMHEFERGRFLRDQTPTSAFEIWHEDGVITFNMVPGSPSLGRRVRDQIFEDYPNSEIRQRARPFPEMEPGQSFAGARLSLLRGSHLPIRHLDIDGFGGDGDVRDPFKNVLTRVAGNDDATVMIQWAFRPRRTRMTFQKRALRAANSLESTHTEWDWGRFKKVPVDPDETDRRAASIIRGENNTAGERRLFEVAVRALVVAPDDQAAQNRLREVVRAMGQYYEGHTKQGFYGEPALRYQPFLAECSERTVPGGVGKDLIDARELAGGVHLPDSGVNNNAIDSSHTKAGNPVPPRTPRFDFGAVGIDDPELVTPRERWREMVRHGHETPGDTDDAIWLGEGTRDGTEAGLPMDDLLHLAITGETGHGKSKEALHIFYQLIERGVGAFYGDPKDGDDAALAVALAILAGRGDDVIPIRVGSDTDHQVTFNFLEVPGETERGSKAYVDKLEPLADVVEGVLAQAGGTGRESWGERMSGITRHLVRGLGQLDLDTPPTLMSMNYAGATETDRETYADYVSDQSIPFIEDTASDVFAEYDSSSIEPWARRVNQVVESGPLREIACNPHGFSLADAVREGKIIVLFGETASDTALKMLMTALVPSLWTVTQELHHDDEEPDPPAFHAFVDELNDIVTPRMDLPQILSNARTYDFHLHGIFQDADSQVSDKVAKAFEGQADSLSVNPGTEDFAKSLASHHSEDVGYEELLDLPEYRQYVRTTDKTGEKTRSYPVNLGHPLAEIDDDVPSEEEALSLVEEREKEIGHEKRTAEEIKADDPFATASGEDVDGLKITEEVERATVQGIHDTAIRQGDRNGFVSLDDALPAVTRRLSRLDSTPDSIGDDLNDGDDLWREVVQHLNDDLLKQNGETFRAKNPRSTIATVGTDQSAGGPEHASTMWDAYPGLTWAGLDVTINDASGDAADALARPAPESEQNAPELVERLTGGGEARIESEHSTGRTKAGVTAQHVMQAANEDRRAIVLSRPEDAQNVADTLRADPPLCRSDHAVDGETRFYTSPRDLRIDGDEMTRPGSRTNVWIRDDDTGEVTLKDDGGAEHARFESVDAVFTDSNPYPDDGDRAIKKPIVPSNLLNDDAEVSEEIVTVPEDADALSDLSLVVGDGDLTAPADAVGRDETGGRGDDLDVPDRANLLLDLLREDGGGPWTTGDAHDVAHESNDDEIHVGKRAIRKYLKALADEDAIRKTEGDTPTDPNEYHLK